MSANLSVKAHGCLDDLLQLDMSQLSPKTLQIVSIFANRLAGPPIGYTVYGLFTVDGSSVLTIIGTLLTYAVIILQLTPGDIAPAVANTTTTSFLNASTY
ncbi:uncharacterized protein [Haliotis asinina]|uniref:uncharacterized protein n=1 Tax=Haliotis asinina TaxID=109174 RepID=UPI0035320A5A